MYFKGANLLHTVRQILNDDEKFRMILRGLNKIFYHQTVTSKQVEIFMSKSSGMDLSKIFDQYLRTTMIPTLEYKIENGKLFYRWANCVKGFNMPVRVSFTPLQYETKKTTPHFLLSHRTCRSPDLRHRRCGRDPRNSDMAAPKVPGQQAVSALTGGSARHRQGLSTNLSVGRH